MHRKNVQHLKFLLKGFFSSKKLYFDFERKITMKTLDK